MELTKKQFVISILPSVFIIIAARVIFYVVLLNLCGHIVEMFADKSEIGVGLIRYYAFAEVIEIIVLSLGIVIGGIIPIRLIAGRDLDMSKYVPWQFELSLVGWIVLIALDVVGGLIFMFIGFWIVALLELIICHLIFKKISGDKKKARLLSLSDPLLYIVIFRILGFIPIAIS